MPFQHSSMTVCEHALHIHPVRGRISSSCGTACKGGYKPPPKVWCLGKGWRHALTIRGLADPLLKKLSKCGKTKTDSHIQRNLHRTMRQFRKVLDVELGTIKAKIRISKRRGTCLEVDYPVVRLSAWAETIFNHGGHFFLAGQSLDYAEEYGKVLVDFWSKFVDCDPDFGFDIPRSQWSGLIPVAIHGDEGRGKGKSPCMVVSIQPILPLFNRKTNMEGHLVHNTSLF